MFKKIGVLSTFLAFAVVLAVSHNLPTEVSTLPQRSLVIAEQTKHQAKIRLQRSLQQFIFRKQHG